MSDQPISRRLAAILAADIAGYAGLTQHDEVGTITQVRRIWTDIFNPAVSAHNGRVVKVMGDGALVEFASVVDAVDCAVAIQIGMDKRNATVEFPVEFRIGVNLGDIIIDGEDIIGDGVNIASRLEGQAQPGGILVSDSVRAQIEGKVAYELRDAGEIKLKNILRPLKVWRWQANRVAKSAEAQIPARSLPKDKPSLVVLPFSNIGNDPEQEFFADGLVEDILAALTKLSGISIISGHSSFAYKQRAVDVRQVASELGVRYVLEGSIRKAANRIRIIAKLSDGGTGAQIWAERFDRDVSDIFTLQDEITLTLATELQVKLTEGEQARLRYTTTSNVDAWSFWIKGLGYDRLTKTPASRMQTRRCWEQALALDPDSAVLNALMGDLHYSDARLGWSGEDRETALRKAERYADRALEIDPECADAHRSRAGALLLRSRFQEAEKAARRATELGSNLPDVLVHGGFVLTCCGYAVEAIFQIERALALNPIYHAWYLGVLGNAYRMAGRTEDALAAFRAYHRRSPGFGLADIVMMQEQAGLLDEARETATELAAARPSFSVQSFISTQFRCDIDQLKRDIASLRAAGVQEQ